MTDEEALEAIKNAVKRVGRIAGPLFIDLAEAFSVVGELMTNLSSPIPAGESKTSNTNTATKPRYFTVQEVAEIASVCTKTVRRRIDDGSLKADRIGQVILVSEGDFLEFMARVDARPAPDQKLRIIKRTGDPEPRPA
ncbi:MAG TPA: helix-turn-helix domain-containing protein [Acidimicrobiales bacterium]